MMTDGHGHECDQPTMCCVRCGAYWLDILKGARVRECITVPNLIAASHLIKRRRLMQELRDAGVME